MVNSMLLVALRKGGAKCSSSCPFYVEKGWVRGMYGVPYKSHCRMTMSPWMVDCDIYNPMCIEHLEVSEEQWKTMQKAVHKHAIKERKEYPEDHAEIHAVGCEWTRGRGRFNAIKSQLKNS